MFLVGILGCPKKQWILNAGSYGVLLRSISLSWLSVKDRMVSLLRNSKVYTAVSLTTERVNES
jgi:hypothetical protein